MPSEDDIFRAAEIGQYAFCARAWWLGRVMGYRPANAETLRRGVVRHQAHGRTVAQAYRLRWAAVVLLALAVMALAVGLILLGAQ